MVLQYYKYICLIEQLKYTLSVINIKAKTYLEYLMETLWNINNVNYIYIYIWYIDVTLGDMSIGH